MTLDITHPGYILDKCRLALGLQAFQQGNKQAWEMKNKWNNGSETAWLLSMLVSQRTKICIFNQWWWLQPSQIVKQVKKRHTTFQEFATDGDAKGENSTMLSWSEYRHRNWERVSSFIRETDTAGTENERMSIKGIDILIRSLTSQLLSLPIPLVHKLIYSFAQ